MVTGGIDVGIKYTKIIIRKDNKIIAKNKGISGLAKREENVKEIWQQTLRGAGLEPTDVDAIVSTGKGKYNVSIADRQKTEIICLEKAVRECEPEATMAVNMGADEILVAVLDRKQASGIAEMAQNQKCSAGLGLMIENLTEEFGWNNKKTAELQGQHVSVISDACAVFGRMDVLENLNRGMTKEDVMLGVLHGTAVRANSVINDITLPNMEKVILCGGLSKNQAFVRELESVSKKKLSVCADAEYMCAIGAAIAAAEYKEACHE